MGQSAFMKSDTRDPLQAREQFAVSLRVSKKKEIISAKRMKLTKSKVMTA